MRSWRPFCCGLPGLIRSMPIPSLSRQTDSFERLNSALGEVKGHTVIRPDCLGQPILSTHPLRGRDGIDPSSRFQRLHGKQVAAGVVGDGERIAVSAVRQHELTLVIGAPEVIGRPRFGEHRICSFVLPSFPALHQTSAVEYRMNGRDRRPVDIRIRPRQECDACYGQGRSGKATSMGSAACMPWSTQYG